MPRIPPFLTRMRAMLLRGRLRAESDDEIQFHLEMEIDHHRARGLSTEDARRAARLSFGGVERFREETRDARGMVWLDSLGQDFRIALRGFRRTPTFAVTAVLVLAIGIGMASA